MTNEIDFLKQVLSIPSKTYNEDLMVQFLVDWLTENKIDFVVDEYKNVYATKNDDTELPDGFYYPCVVSHTDTVHDIDKINIREEILPNSQNQPKKSLKAYNDLAQPTGIGGDDKCGIFACLTLLKELPNLKAAFFVAEETGCHGSKKADRNFFSDVGYAIQFDAPENWMITEKCFGQDLFDRDSQFFEKSDKILSEGMEDKKYMIHPYTDVYALRSKFDFSCINLSIGYYNYHTPHEYVVIEDVFNGIDMGRKMIESLGNKLYYKKAKDQKYSYKYLI